MKSIPSKNTTARRKSKITNAILQWYSRSARRLPWRGARSPYHILLSEIMLQQTQVSRVLRHYPRFLKRFPSIRSLARARTSSVIRSWKGMGYNSRAVRLQSLARTIMMKYKNTLPRSIEELELLPGIGKYTAHAIACLAFGKHVPVVDTNVERVLSRLYPRKSKKETIWNLAQWALPLNHAQDWNQALMDLGSTVCTSRTPKCFECPVTKLCPSSFNAERAVNARSGKEPSRDGFPNRIYRGRVVEVLRHAPARLGIPLSRLGPMVKHSFSVRDQQWLLKLTSSLEKDGLVIVRRTRQGLAASLPQ